MDFDEIKERYKVLPLWARFLIAGIIGLLPGAYVYYDEGDALQSQLDETAGKETAARSRFETARLQKANLPKLEEELEFTEEQLLKAKKKLPDDYRIEEVLQKTATIAKEVGVALVVFDPTEEIQHQLDYKYVELPIKAEIRGRFAQIASFFDRIVHLENSIFVRKIEISKAPSDKKDWATTREMAKKEKTEFQIARENRQNLRLKSVFELAVFRGMTEAEANARPRGENGEEIPPGEDLEKAAAEDTGAEAAPKGGESARAIPAKPDDVTTF